MWIWDKESKQQDVSDNSFDQQYPANQPTTELTGEARVAAEADVEGDGAALREAAQQDLLRRHARRHLALDDLH
jgi:hypothetical protein